MSPVQIGTIWLIAAIITDVISTVYMAKADGFNNIPALVIGGMLYFGSFIACVIALKYMQAGILYVLWAGIGAVATAMLSKFFMGQEIDLHGWVGIVIICLSVGYIAQFSSIDV